jgi:hypothetical protein
MSGSVWGATPNSAHWDQAGPSPALVPALARLSGGSSSLLLHNRLARLHDHLSHVYFKSIADSKKCIEGRIPWVRFQGAD